MNGEIETIFDSKNLELISDNDYFRFRLKGLRTLEKMQIFWDYITHLSYNSTKNFIIEENMIGKLNIIEIFTLIKFIENSGFNRNIKIAIILQDHSSYDIFFFEGSLFRRGYKIKHFLNEEEALIWFKPT